MNSLAEAIMVLEGIRKKEFACFAFDCKKKKCCKSYKKGKRCKKCPDD